MAKYTFKYGNGTREFEYPEEDVIKVLEPTVLNFPINLKKKSSEMLSKIPSVHLSLKKSLNPDRAYVSLFPTLQEHGQDRLSSVMYLLKSSKRSVLKMKTSSSFQL